MSSMLNTLDNIPLKTYLILLLKAENASYNNYMQGAELLADWLGPIDLPEPPVKDTKPMARIFISYELKEIARILYPKHINYGCRVLLQEINKLALEDIIKEDITWLASYP